MAKGVARWLAVACLAGLAGACASRPPAPPPTPPADPAAACLSSLDQRGIAYRRLDDWTTPEGCSVLQAVQVERSALAWNRPAAMTCPMAAAIWDYETAVVQPAARRIMGRSVKTLIHAGTYSCRAVKSEDRRNRLSQHALGQAIDIVGFALDDGTVINVRRHWDAKGPEKDFLRAVSKGACSIFSVVLTPNSNSLHNDHLHLDMGPYKLCSV